jgi:Fur family ferric uptake transcriptional regulator
VTGNLIQEQQSLHRGEALHLEVADRLRRVDQRYTSGRRAIVEVLEAVRQPVSIGDIGRLLPALPRSSAYRHLVDLQGAGVVRRVAANDEFARYELAEDLTEHHHHLLCVSCGKVVDVTPPSTFERNIDKTVGALATEQGFQAHSHRLDILGLCAPCRGVGIETSGRTA